MILLFEGVDKSGKSTLIKNLKEIRPLQGFWKNMVFKPDSSIYSQGKISGLYLGFYEALKSMETSRFPFLMDRSHVTEIVYSEIKRNYSADTSFWRDYEKTLDAAIVYVDTPIEIIEARLQKEGDDYVNIDDLRKLKFNYEEYFRRYTRLKVIRIDGSKTETEMLIELNQKINEYRREKDKDQQQ